MYVATDVSPACRSLSLKTTREGFAALCATDQFTPAPYLARYFWVRCADISALDEDQLSLLVQGSYQLVVNRLTKKQQRALGQV